MTESGTKTIRMPAIHATDWINAQRMSPVVSAGFTWKRPRSASARTEIGLWRAKVCSQPGIVATGTKALEANVRGKSQMRQPDRGRDAAECHRLHEDPRHEEVNVLPAGNLDRTAEHVAKEEHEHDRLDGDEHDQLRHPHGFQNTALGQHQRVEERPHDAWPNGDRRVARSRA